MRKHHANHGRDHLPGGADPIPFTVDPGGCPDCVLDPYTVSPGDIVVPPAYYECVDVSAHAESSPGTPCGTGNVFLVNSMPAGYCSGYDLSKTLKMQVRAVVALGGNTENIIIYAGPGGVEGQVYSYGWEPGESPSEFDTGWVEIGDVCGGSCSEITASLSFQSHAVFSGGCASGGLGVRWVEVDDDGNYQGALDELPQGDQQNDVIHFDSRTHSWVTDPSSVPSRAISTFMG